MILDHTYYGKGWWLSHEDVPIRRETVSGAFRVIEHDTDDGSVVIGNGEFPEGRWLVYDLDALRPVE